MELSGSNAYVLGTMVVRSIPGIDQPSLQSGIPALFSCKILFINSLQEYDGRK
jgi:hypothetical protein